MPPQKPQHGDISRCGMDYDQQLAEYLARKGLELWRAGSWDGLLSLIVISLQYRKIRYLREACRRANALRLTERNETWRTAFEIFTHAPPPKLEDLANDTGSDFTLR